MKILLIGKTGQLGGSLLDVNIHHEIFVPSRSELDIENIEQSRDVLNDYKPDAVINTAAFHNVPLCEIESDKAFKINCKCISELSKICKEFNSKLITFSSDYVFGGDKRTPYSETDKPMPLQIYGITRLAGEYAAISAAPDNTIIIRTCGLYGHNGASSKGGNFVDMRIKDALENAEIEMGNDQTVIPTYTDDLANAVISLLENKRSSTGIYHLVNEGECTWYDFTKKIISLMSLTTLVRPVDRGGKSGEMRRPLYSVLGNYRAKKIGITLPHWEDALKNYLEKKY